MFGKEEASEDESSDDEWGPQKGSKQKPEISQNELASTKKPSGNKRSAEGAAKTGIGQSKAKEVAKLENTQMSFQKLCGKEEPNNYENSNGSEQGSRKRRKQKPDVVASFRSPSCNNKSLDDSTKVETQQPKLVLRKRNNSTASKMVGKTAAKQDSAQAMDTANRTKIPEMAVQRLKGAFAENALPSKSYKECLSKELGLSYERVSMWFKSQRKYIALKKRRSLAISPLPNTAGSPKLETADVKDQVFLPFVLQEPGDINKSVEEH
ncbi:hypothetical protein O6H91_05G123400 [Diphasiastrum complanatum]|uniref:Uncharacterized protein n=1 Tax=Diphasiastrum complanatum TaxID=34168 RepID=A0ACC2DTP6_DIPCM|nr:hypothetical protein O6H91_05G123400 [Diphasiastrum complanatum]